MALKTNYKDDILAPAMGGKRRFNLVENSDGTVSLVDATTYTQQGDMFGASDINSTNTDVNKNSTDLATAKTDITQIKDNLTQVEDNLTQVEDNLTQVEDNLSRVETLKNRIGVDLTYEELCNKTETTFFTNWRDGTNFPALYGSGFLMVGLDPRNAFIYYVDINNRIFYKEKNADGWDRIYTQSTLISNSNVKVNKIQIDYSSNPWKLNLEFIIDGVKYTRKIPLTE